MKGGVLMRLLRSHILAAIVLVGFSGCISGFPAIEGSFDRTLSVSGPVNLDITTGSGKIEVRAGSSGVVKVYAFIRARDDGRARAEEKLHYLQANPPIEQTGNSIRIGRINEEAYRNNVSISYEIQTPDNTRLVAKTGSGNQRIEGLKDSIDISTGSGSIVVFNIGSDVIAHTGSGNIEADSATGKIDLQTGSGSIRANRIAGSVKAGTGSGNIAVEQASSEQSAILDIDAHTGSGSISVSGITGFLRASTGSGNINANGKPGGDWNIHTGSGSISLIIPQDVSFDLNAITHSGGINVDHPVTVKGSMGKGVLQGKVRGGGRLVAVQTGSGTISIR
jgi:hypothetical protein